MPEQQPVHLHEEDQNIIDAVYQEHASQPHDQTPELDMTPEEALAEIRSITPIMWQVRQIKLKEQRGQEALKRAA